MYSAIFLDRDGVIIEDVHLLINPGNIHILPGVPEALYRLKKKGYKLIVISNQTVIARGLASEKSVCILNGKIQQLIAEKGGPNIDMVYFCPHHPNATISNYRIDCECRKPRPGLIFRAANENDIDLKASYLIGDRITDIIAGKGAGCKTILVETGKHILPAIESVDPIDTSTIPDHICADLLSASAWILQNQ